MQLCPPHALSFLPPSSCLQFPPSGCWDLYISHVHTQAYLNPVYACLQSKVNFKLKQMFVCSVCTVDVFKRQMFSLLAFAILDYTSQILFRCDWCGKGGFAWLVPKPAEPLVDLDVKSVWLLCVFMLCAVLWYSVPQGLSTTARISPGPHLYWVRYVAFSLGRPCCD